MPRILTGTDVLGVTLDATIGATEPDDVRVAIMRDGLIYGAIVVQGTAVLWANDGFRQIVNTSDGAELLRNGIIVPLIEDNVSSFAASLERAQARQMANLDPLADRVYADFLERESSGGATFPTAQVANRYKRTFAITNVVENLTGFGISPTTAERYLKLVEQYRSDPQAGTNSLLWDTILPQLPATERSLVWQCARLPYITSVPLALRIGIACPEGFEGDRLLTNLARHDRTLPSLTISPASAHIGRFHLEINEAAISWLLSTETLRQMTAEDLATAHAIPSRIMYSQRKTKCQI